MFRVFSKMLVTIRHTSIEDKFLMSIEMKLLGKGGAVKCHCFVRNVGY